MEERQPNLIATYNDMQLKILRLDESWRKAISFRRNAEYNKLIEELIIIWDELYPLVVKNNFKKIIEFNEKVNLKIAETKKKEMLKGILDTKYRFLKYVQDKVGLGTKTKKETEEDEELDY